MIKKLALALLTTALAASASFATDYTSDYVIINGTYFDCRLDTANPNFQGHDFGTFNQGDSLTLNGGQANLTATSNDYFNNTNFQNLNYFITGQSNGYNGGNQFINLPLTNNATPPNYQFQNTGANTNLLSGLAPGVYTMSVFFTGNASYFDNGQQYFSTLDNNGGTNYVAQFTVAPVPEPSSLSLIAGPAMLGAWFFVRRRRA